MTAETIGPEFPEIRQGTTCGDRASDHRRTQVQPVDTGPLCPHPQLVARIRADHLWEPTRIMWTQNDLSTRKKASSSTFHTPYYRYC